MGSKTRLRLFAAAASGVVVGVVIAWLSSDLNRSMADITDAAQYAPIVSKLRSSAAGFQSPLFSAFPITIPANALNPRLFYRPHFGQGGAILQLRYGLPAADIRALVARLASAAILIAADEQPATSATTNTFFVWPNFRNSDNTGWQTLPEDFKVYVLQNVKSDPVDPETQSSGVAISEKRNEVIYWLAE